MAQWIQNPKVSNSLLCILSGLLLALCFPPFNIGQLNIVVLIPALFALNNHSLKWNYAKGFLAGIAFYLPLLYWVGHAVIPGMIALVIYVSIFFAIPFSIYRLTPQPWLRPVMFGIIWGLIEYIRTLGYFSFAWGFLAHGSDLGLLFVQIPYATIPVISGIIATVNALLYEATNSIKSKSFEGQKKILRTAVVWGVLLISIILPILFASVYITLNLYTKSLDDPTDTKQSLKVALLQGDFGMEAEDYYDTRDEVDVYLDLAAQAMTQSPELIIFPESTISVSLNHSTRYIRQLSEFVDSNDVEMLVGAVHGLYDSEGSWKFWNRAYLFSPGQVFDYSQDPVNMAGMQTYDKMHLVPYGEWIPFGDIPVFGWIETLIEEAGAGIFQRGTEQTIFELRNGAKFGVGICFESTLSSQLKNAKQKGADFLVNITNDAWFKRSPGLAQHFLQSQFRAAENNCYMLRCANTGITAVIKPNGQIQTRIPDNEVGYLVDTINY